MNAVQLPRHIVNQLLEQTLNAGNAEICGLIASRNGIPSTCYPVANVAANTDSQFQLEPKQQINAMRTMRETGQTLFAIYHSHPKTPATPSKQDIEQANLTHYMRWMDQRGIQASTYPELWQWLCF